MLTFGRTSTGRGSDGAPVADDERLRRMLERRLLPAAQRGRGVSTLRRGPNVVGSRAPTEVLTIGFEDGSELAMFVKHVDDDREEHPDKTCRDREIRAYEELLAEPGLPVPRYYGSSRDPRARRRDLFLEYIPDWDLRYQELEHWYTAARRLAELQVHCAEHADRLVPCEWLLQLDADYLHRWAERAIHVAEGYGGAAGAELARIAGRCGRVAEALAALPPTLVHNDLAPKNVVADRSTHPARIAFVDWEQAGVGCGVLDLVDLTYGLDAPAEERMRRAYCDVLTGTPLLPSSAAEQARLLAAAQLHRVIYRLAHAASWSLPVETVRRWVGFARKLAGRSP